MSYNRSAIYKWYVGPLLVTFLFIILLSPRFRYLGILDSGIINHSVVTLHDSYDECVAHHEGIVEMFGDQVLFDASCTKIPYKEARKVIEQPFGVDSVRFPGLSNK